MADSVSITNLPDPGSKEAIAYKLWQLLRDNKETREEQLRFYSMCLNTVMGYPPE